MPRLIPSLSPFTSLALSRSLHTSTPRLNAVKPTVQNIAALRRARPVPMSLAREALAASNNDVERALTWLEKQMSASAAKAAKVSGRSTNEGTIAVSLLSGKRVSMIHLGCETDFVARNDVFLKTARGVAGTAAFLDVPSEAGPKSPQLGSDPILEFPPPALLSAPLIALPNSGEDGSSPIPTSDPQTIQQSLLSALGSTGENLKLLRAVTFAAPFPSSADIRYVPGCYAHGGASDSEGRVAAIAVLAATSRDAEKPIATLIHGPNGNDLETELSKLARTISRQIVGFPTKVIARKNEKDLDEGEVLLEQPFMMMGEERKVGEVLREWGTERGIKVDVVGMRRWAVGDAIETDESASAETS
ncbi:putative elongation factor ts (ef-ts) [Papiliotrema laurentii]|uniref:Elongation factor Ts, mitochondrial n=1 Tax=Papiliotrema laurentii TaxID=5418 RepID=A0AAD9FV71_PAPLA|nr:putative elongation factor ts (ef-ts) [Papiliotrema laurentii]